MSIGTIPDAARLASRASSRAADMTNDLIFQNWILIRDALARTGKDEISVSIKISFSEMTDHSARMDAKLSFSTKVQDSREDFVDVSQIEIQFNPGQTDE